MHKKLIWNFLNSKEYDITYMGNYGAKGEKRAPRKTPTSEQIKKQNQKNRETSVRRLIKKNFNINDVWATLKYAKGQRPSTEEVQDDLKRFKNNMRTQYKKAGIPFKFIQRMEIGKNGGIHIHMLVNKITGSDLNTYELISKYWNPKRQTGGVHMEPLYAKGDFKDLASYIVKEPDEEQNEQLSLFPLEEKKRLVKYSTSRNLIRPQPQVKIYTRRTVRKIIENGIEPTPGFYIDEESIHIGVNPFTGMSYIHYTELRINPIYPEPAKVKWPKSIPKKRSGRKGGMHRE